MNLTFYIVSLLVGLVGAVAYLKFARKTHAGRERKVYATGLVVAATIYVLFAVLWGDLRWIGIEILGLFGFGLFVVAGCYYGFLWVALAWLLHPVWDVALHLHGPGSHIAPAWYAIACMSFDVLVGATISYRVFVWRKAPSG